MAWRLAHSLETFRSQINERYPTRDKRSDGTIGDAAHAASASDHNPNAQGVVCAFDLDVDLNATPNIDAIAESIRASRDSRLKYLILKGQVFRSYDKPGIPAWTWAAYTGADPHTSHAHLSVGHGPDGKSTGNYDDPSPWVLPGAPQEDDMTGPEHDLLIHIGNTLDALTAPGGPIPNLGGQVAALQKQVDKLASSGGGGPSGDVKVTGTLTLG